MSQTPGSLKTVEGALELGFSLSEAVQRALGESLSEFARRHGFRRQEVSMCLLAYHQRIYPEIRDAVAGDLGVSRDQVDRWIEEQSEATTAS